MFHMVIQCVVSSIAQPLVQIRVKIDHFKVYIRVALGAGEMDLALGAGRYQGFGTGLDGFLHPFGLNHF